VDIPDRAPGLEELQSLLGRSPDPRGDRVALLALDKRDEPETRRLMTWLQTDPAWEHRPLREMLPGLDLVEAPSLRDRLGVRAANCLGQIGAANLPALAGLTPADIQALPRVGVTTFEEILLAVVGEWATAYLRQGGHTGDATPLPDRAAPISGHGGSSLVEAFDKLEGLPAFVSFKHRRLESTPVTARAIARAQGVSAQRIGQRVAEIDRMISRRMRDPDWPIRVAVERLQSRLGSVARATELVGTFAALDRSGALSSRHPDR
jgi:hypothetical protein